MQRFGVCARLKVGLWCKKKGGRTDSSDVDEEVIVVDEINLNSYNFTPVGCPCSLLGALRVKVFGCCMSCMVWNVNARVD